LINDLQLIVNLPVVYMAWDVMILMQAKVGQGTLEGLGPDDQDVGD
jgi:hypothetical protein